MKKDDIVDIHTAGLSEKDLDVLRKFGALNWSEQDICGYFNFDPAWFHLQWLNPASIISRCVRQGGLQERAKVELEIFRNAQKGDIDSVTKFQQLTRDKSFSMSKLDLFGGTADMDAFNRVSEYISSGSRGKLTEDEAIYIDLLTMVYSLDGRFGKRKTIKFLTSSPFDFTYDRASGVYSEAVEMFYCNRNVSKAALREKAAAQYDALYHLALEAAKTTKDYEIASNILTQKSKVLNLDKEDPVRLPETQYQKQYRLLSISPEVIGLPAANRDELAGQIDALVDVPVLEKERLRMEASIEDMDIVKILENVSQEES